MKLSSLKFAIAAGENSPNRSTRCDTNLWSDRCATTPIADEVWGAFADEFGVRVPA